MASKQSKKLDQLYLSKAELNQGGEWKPLLGITTGLSFAFACSCKAVFGVRWYKRLVNSASRRNKSPLGYALDVLLK